MTMTSFPSRMYLMPCPRFFFIPPPSLSTSRAENVCVRMPPVTSHPYSPQLDSLIPIVYYLALRRHTSDLPRGCQSSRPVCVESTYHALFTTAWIRNIYILLAYTTFPTQLERGKWKRRGGDRRSC